MPQYEYERKDPEECLMCPGRFIVLQGIKDPPLEFCPSCGMPCRRVVSRVSIKTKPDLTASRAAEKGLTTFKRTRFGEWEKVDGPGVDGIVATDDQKQQVASEKVKKIDLDKP